MATLNRVEAIDYEKSRGWMSDSQYIQQFIGLVSLSSEAVVLDAGCGGGYVSAALVPKVGRLLQIDHSWATLNSNGTARDVETLKADLHDLWMMAPRSFDVIFCRSVFHRLAEPERARDELYRLLKPQGHLVLSVSHAPEEHRDEFRAIMEQKGPRLYHTYAEWKDLLLTTGSVSLVAEGELTFSLNLAEWGLLTEHQQASRAFQEHCQLQNERIECRHAYFVLQKM